MKCPSRARSLVAVVALLTTSPEVEAQVTGFDDVAWTFGELDGPAEQIIGDIRDLVVSDEGQVAVIDRLSSRIGLLAENGRLLGWIGQAGDGPEEYKYLNSAAFLPSGDLVVVDQGHTRLVTVGVREGSLQFLSSSKLPFVPEEVCALGQRLFVSGWYDESVLHEVSADGEVLRSFGEPVQGPDMPEEWQNTMLAYSVMGELLCIEEKMLVVHMPSVYPIMRAFDHRGQAVWTTRLEPWHQRVFSVTDEGRFQMAWDEDGLSNSADKLWILNSESIVVGVDTHDPSRRRRNLIDAFVLDAATGEVQGVEKAVPRMAGRANGGIVAWEVEPFPRILKLLRP